MIALLALAAAVVAPDWELIGTSTSGLRIFVDRASVRDRGALREAGVRMGSPRVIVGRIVEVRQREQFDCRARRWRMMRFTAYDEKGAVVARTKPNAAPSALIAVTRGSISAAILEEVCSLAPQPTKQRPISDMRR